MYKQLSFRPIDDFSMVSQIVEYPFVLATRSRPFGTKHPGLDQRGKDRTETDSLRHTWAGIGSAFAG